MDQINAIMRTQLSEREVMIFLLVMNGGFTYRQLGDILGVSHTNIRKTYDKAKAKMDKAGELGYFQTIVENTPKKD